MGTLGALVNCSQCVKSARWVKCVTCNVMFIKHASILCPDANHEHDDSHTIIDSPASTLPRGERPPIDDEIRFAWHG